LLSNNFICSISVNFLTMMSDMWPDGHVAHVMSNKKKTCQNYLIK